MRFRKEIIMCGGCGNRITFDSVKSNRDHQTRLSGYCNIQCKEVVGVCTNLCCRQRASHGKYCEIHKLEGFIKETKKHHKLANKWCEGQGYSLSHLPSDLAFQGWPDNPIACQELKTSFDFVRWEQIVRFAWIKQYYGREVQIVWIKSFLDGVRGHSKIFSNWQEHFNWLNNRRQELYALKKAGKL